MPSDASPWCQKRCQKRLQVHGQGPRYPPSALAGLGRLAVGPPVGLLPHQGRLAQQLRSIYSTYLHPLFSSPALSSSEPKPKLPDILSVRPQVLPVAVGAEPRVPVLGPEDLAGGLSALHVANFAILDGALVDGLFTFSLHQGSSIKTLCVVSNFVARFRQDGF